MGLHPCCGGSLQTGTKMIAIFQIVVSVLVFVLFALFFIGGIAVIAITHGNDNSASTMTTTTTSDPNTVTYATTESTFNTTMSPDDKAAVAAITVGLLFAIMVVFVIFFGGFSLIMGILLLKGAKQRHAWKCRAWLIIRSICFLLSLMTFISGLFRDNGHFLPISGAFIIFDIYCMWVVYAFITEVAEEEREKKDSVKRIVYDGKA